MATKKPESKLVTKVLEALRKEGGFWFKVHGDMFQMAGLPDIIGCFKGRFIGIELKTWENPEPYGSKIQQYIGKKIQEAGGTWGVAHSVEEALNIIKIFE